MLTEAHQSNQGAKYIALAAKSPAAKIRPHTLTAPAVTYVTTFGVQLSPTFVALATKKKVTLRHTKVWEMFLPSRTGSGRSKVTLFVTLTLNPTVQAARNRITGHPGLQFVSNAYLPTNWYGSSGQRVAAPKVVHPPI